MRVFVDQKIGLFLNDQKIGHFSVFKHMEQNALEEMLP
jgi:hypothetical protein